MMDTGRIARDHNLDVMGLNQFCADNNIGKANYGRREIQDDMVSEVVERYQEHLENAQKQEKAYAEAQAVNREKARKIREKMRIQEENDVVYDITGVRGRSLRVYPYKCVITTRVTLGSVLTGNVTDGEKTIYFTDCIGVQYKKPGGLLGYLQFETAANTMNNQKSNFFNENTFTFEKDEKLVEEIYEYVIGILNDIKTLSCQR